LTTISEHAELLELLKHLKGIMKLSSGGNLPFIISGSITTLRLAMKMSWGRITFSPIWKPFHDSEHRWIFERGKTHGGE